MASLLRLAGLLWHAGSRLVASKHNFLAVQAWVHGRALGHSLGGGSVIIQCYSVLLGQALGVYLDVLLLRIVGLLSELIELSIGHVAHGACIARRLAMVTYPS